MAAMSRSRRLAALLLLLAVAAASGVAAKLTSTEQQGAAAAAKEDDPSWTGWAKDKISEGLGLDKISEGLGLKHAVADDEEDAARKAGHTVKSARESAQHVASGNLTLLET